VESGALYPSKIPRTPLNFRACRKINPTHVQAPAYSPRMRIDAPPISAHKLQRLHCWILLWLKWFAAFLAGAEAFAPFTSAATKEAHRWLDRIERGVISVVILRAYPRIRLLRRLRYSSHRRNETQIFRAVIGAALRRSLRVRDLRQRIEVLSQNVDALVARLVRRLPHGLTRRRPILARPEMHTPACAVAPATCIIPADDSS
jgi:hypothetical protein